MPHLLNFIQGKGTLMKNDHTVLISHTATGILTSLTGVYPDRMGQPVCEQFPLLQNRWHDPHRCIIRLLDSAAVRPRRQHYRHDAGDDQRERQDRALRPGHHTLAPAATLGPSRRRTRSSKTRRSIFRRCSVANSPEAAEVTAEPWAGVRRLCRDRCPLRARLGDLLGGAQWPPRPATRRAGRLHRLQWALRGQVR